MLIMSKGIRLKSASPRMIWSRLVSARLKHLGISADVAMPLIRG